MTEGQETLCNPEVRGGGGLLEEAVAVGKGGPARGCQDVGLPKLL